MNLELEQQTTRKAQIRHNKKNSYKQPTITNSLSEKKLSYNLVWTII